MLNRMLNVYVFENITFRSHEYFLLKDIKNITFRSHKCILLKDITVIVFLNICKWVLFSQILLYFLPFFNALLEGASLLCLTSV